MRNITVNTKLAGLLGTPLAQSFSAASHNAVYEEMGWDLVYLPIEIARKEDFGAVVEGIRRMNFAGFAITKPYKVEILKYLDEIDEITEQIGACNTVVITDGRFKGYNTDGIGAITSLREEAGVRFEGGTFFCFGAGGTAKSVCLELAARKAKRIYIASRSKSCAELAEKLNAAFPEICEAIQISESDKVYKAVSESDVLLNLTGLGMAGHLDETPLDKSVFKAGQICFDATYNPEKTLFLKDAEAAGCKTVNGLGMLAYQGTKQIQLWTGNPEPFEPMKRHLLMATHLAGCLTG